MTSPDIARNVEGAGPTDPTPDLRFQGFTLVPQYDKGVGATMVMQHVCGPVDTSIGSASLLSCYMVALAHRCPGQKADELRAAGQAEDVIDGR